VCGNVYSLLPTASLLCL